MPVATLAFPFAIHVILNTQVGRVKHMRVMPGGALEQEDAGSSSGSSKFFVGRKLQEHRGAFLLEHPMADGIVQGWDAMEVLWESVFRFGITVDGNE
eukprot:scaffold1600_cov179-Amphora_coffeaeformis.AAC.5